MRSSSPHPCDRCIASLAAVLVMAWGLLLLNARPAVGSELDVVAVVAPAADRQARLVADVRAAAAGSIPSRAFSVSMGDVRLPARAVPVISDHPTIGLVIDASKAGAANVEAGLSGAANFLLRMPFAARTVVVADTEPPRILAPPQKDTTEALRALALSPLPPGGARNTSKALTLALSQLPETKDGCRVVVLYTTATDVAGETADELARRLTNAHAVLSVVTPGVGAGYWSRVATATGGVAVAARPTGIMTAFDRVADALQSRYMVTFSAPGQLPATVSVRVTTADGTLVADAVVPPAQDVAGSAGAPRSPPADSDGGGGGAPLLRLVVFGLAAGLLASVLLVAWPRRRARSRQRAASGDLPQPNWTHQELNFLLHGATHPDDGADDAPDAASKAASDAASDAEVSAPPAEEAPRPRERIFDVSDSAAPREIASVEGPELEDVADNTPAVDATPTAVDREEAEKAAAPATSKGTPVPNGVAEAQRRARAVGAATRAAAQAAATPLLRRRSGPNHGD